MRMYSRHVQSHSTCFSAACIFHSPYDDSWVHVSEEKGFRSVKSSYPCKFSSSSLVSEQIVFIWSVLLQGRNLQQCQSIDLKMNKFMFAIRNEFCSSETWNSSEPCRLLGLSNSRVKEVPPHLSKELGEKQCNSTAIKNGFENKERSYNL